MKEAIEQRDQAVKDDKRLKKKVADLESELEKERLAAEGNSAAERCDR